MQGNNFKPQRVINGVGTAKATSSYQQVIILNKQTGFQIRKPHDLDGKLRK